MKTDLIVFLGQSNMQGQTERLSENETVEGAFEYRLLTDELVPLKNPIGENITCDYTRGFDADINDLQKWLNNHLAGAAVDGNTNLVPSFCRAYIRATGRCVVAVHVAKGSTEIKYWSPSQAGYSIIARKMSAAINKVGRENIEHMYCVWLQGESDAVAGTSKELYKKHLTELKNEIKSQFGLDRFGIIKVGAFTNDERDTAIFNAQEELCAEDSDFVMLTRITEQLIQKKEYLNPNAAGHYGSLGQEVLGQTAGRNLALFTQNATTEISELLTLVSMTFGRFKAGYREGVSCGELLSAFEESLKRDVPGCRLQYDFLCGADTAGIDGSTDGSYVPKPGDAILIDISVCRADQWCDVTRTYFVGGYTEEQKKVFELIKKSIRAGEKALRAGAKAGDVYDAVNAVYAEAGRSLVHHAGHMIGKDPVMQPQFLAGRETAVEAGRFYAIESGLYDKSGIRLENDYFVNESGAENLFEDLMPLEIEDYIL